MGVQAQTIPTSERAQEVLARTTPLLQKEFAQQKLQWGSAVFVRIFKEKNSLELWVKAGKKFHLFKTYPICKFSGKLGPKTKEGDLQAPEGFYEVKPNQLNPNSDYHLSFNLGYPNTFDLAQNYTGSYLMVHGNCVSVGCYAMTDPFIEEIYTLLQVAFEHGQRVVSVHIFPFDMTENNLDKNKTHPFAAFWRNLSEGYSLFERTANLPRVNVRDKKYVFD